MKNLTSFVAVAGVILLASALTGCGDDDDGGSGGGTGATGGSGGSGGSAGSAGTGATGGSAGTGATGGSAGTGATGGSAGAGGGSGGLDVSEACANTASANCPQEDDEATCNAEMSALLEPYLTECGTQVDGLIGCVATANITCNADTGKAVVNGCETEQLAFRSCAACAPLDEDSECATCTKQDCCPELQALAIEMSTQNAEAYAACVQTNCASLCE